MKSILLTPALLLGALQAQAGDDSTVRIVTLGDSITRGVRPGVKAEETFSHLLQEALKKQKIKAEVINVGIGGERSDQALARLDKAVIARKPVLVAIMYGTNDSYIYKGKKHPEVSPDDFRRNLTALVENLRKAGIQPLLMTEPCWGAAAGKNDLGENHNVRLERYSQICREVAGKTKTPLVDNFAFWSEKQKSGVDVGSWTTDQCHPNPRGHREIADLMLPVVLKMLKKTAHFQKD